MYNFDVNFKGKCIYGRNVLSIFRKEAKPLLFLNIYIYDNYILGRLFIL